MPERWAILGAGRISFSHALSLVRSKHAELVAFADIDPAARERAAAQFGVPGYASIEELLDHSRPDAVTLALPTDLHAAGARLAASRGVHVLCEKPLGSTVAECDEMIRACAEEGVRLGSILNNRGYAQVRWLRERIHAGSYHPRAFTVTLAMQAPGGENDPTAASLLLLGAGIHYLDLLSFWFGELLEVAAVESTGNATSAALRFDGVSGVFRLSAHAAGGRPVRIDIDGAEGHVAFVGASGEFDPSLGTPPAPPEQVEGLPFGTGHLVVIDEAAAALAAGAPFPVDGSVGRASVAMVARVVSAARARPPT